MTAIALRVATFNIYKRLSDARKLDDLGDLLAAPNLSVAGLQEINWELTGHVPNGWAFWQPPGYQERKDPILWRDDVWARVEVGNERVSDRLVSSSSTVPARDLVWAVLKHRATGHLCIFANLHSNAGVEEPAGHPNNLPRTREFTEGLHGAVAELNRLQARHNAPVLWVGDFNVDYGADKRVRDPRFPYAILTGNGFECVWELGEQSTRRNRPRAGRTIDHVWARGTADRAVTFTHVMTPTRWGGWATGDVESDHLPVYVDLELVAAQPPAEPEPVPPAEPEPAAPNLNRFVSRDAWGASSGGATARTHPIGRTEGITAHWEGPGLGGFGHELCARKVRAIERFHRVNRGWADIAYNAVVCPHGYVFEGRGPGVKPAANGTSATNDAWYAVCYLGGVGDGFTTAGRDGFRWAFAWLAHTGNAGPRRNGHRDHKATACPGDQIYGWVHSASASQPSDYLEDTMPSAKELMEHRITDREKDRDVGDALRRIFAVDRKVSQLVRALDPEALADAVVAKLSAAAAETAGGVGAEDIKEAVKAALREGVADADNEE